MLKRIGNVPQWCHTISTVPLLTLVVITTIDVVARYIFRTAVLDTAEISGMLLGILISLAYAFPTYKGEQINFSLVVDRFSRRARDGARVITLLISMFIFILIGWQAITRVISSGKSGEFTGTMEIPLWPTKLVFAFGMLLTAICLIVNFVSSLHRTGK